MPIRIAGDPVPAQRPNPRRFHRVFRRPRWANLVDDNVRDDVRGRGVGPRGQPRSASDLAGSFVYDCPDRRSSLAGPGVVVNPRLSHLVDPRRRSYRSLDIEGLPLGARFEELPRPASKNKNGAAQPRSRPSTSPSSRSRLAVHGRWPLACITKTGPPGRGTVPGAARGEYAEAARHGSFERNGWTGPGAPHLAARRTGGHPAARRARISPPSPVRVRGPLVGSGNGPVGGTWLGFIPSW